ncbi:MAG: molybdopterin-guanine dinucleotide biosynthesis protein B, partial [Thermoplasmata archaeon]|nr:molybdopterin-guanine dinucleotide biosynthesis protein B [Thermoplasmata archaeon]
MLVGIYGFTKSGKTVLIEKLTAHFTEKGFRVATIKHVHHENFSLDKEKTDTWRHAKAGSKLVVMASDVETAFMVKDRMEFGDIVKKINSIQNNDLILVEGFKGKELPKIAVGDIENESDTIFRFQDNFDDIVKHIERHLQAEKILERLPKLDCKKCGTVCAELSLQILDGEKEFKDCVYYSEIDLSIKVDDKELPLGHFAKDIISKTVKGMVSSLKGVDGSKIGSIEF